MECLREVWVYCMIPRSYSYSCAGFSLHLCELVFCEYVGLLTLVASPQLLHAILELKIQSV